jgi:phosphoglucosamine mutase
VPDAIMAVGKFVEMAALSGKFSVLKKKFKQNPMFRGKFKAPDKHKSMEKIIPIIEGMKLPGRLRVDDGIRVDEEGGWFLVRASGTEPLIRLTMEYNSSSALENRKKQLEELITNSI